MTYDNRRRGEKRASREDCKPIFLGAEAGKPADQKKMKKNWEKKGLTAWGKNSRTVFKGGGGGKGGEGVVAPKTERISQVTLERENGEKGTGGVRGGRPLNNPTDEMGKRMGGQ